MKIRFIFNPISGKNRKSPVVPDRARQFLSANDLEGSVVATERPGHATELARRALDDGCTHVAAIGGDGTMNEVAAALVNTPAIFALIPCGSGNGLGRHLGIRSADEDAFGLLLHGVTHAIDAGSVNGMPFFNATGFGFEAEIARRFAARRSRGLAGYAIEGFPLLFSHSTERCRIQTESGVQELEVFTLAVMNSDQYGNDAVVAPGARVDDGMLDLVSVRRVGAAGALGLVGRLIAGSFDRSDAVSRLRGRQFVIERPRAGWIHRDGEPCEAAAEVVVTLQPRALRMMIPNGYASQGKRQKASPGRAPESARGANAILAGFFRRV